MAAIHGAGVIHRDLYGWNFMYKVTDGRLTEVKIDWDGSHRPEEKDFQKSRID